MRVKVGKDTYHFRTIETPIPEWMIDANKALAGLEVVAIDQKAGMITCRSRK